MYSNNAKYRKWQQFSLGVGISCCVYVLAAVFFNLAVFIIEWFHPKEDDDEDGVEEEEEKNEAPRVKHIFLPIFFSLTAAVKRNCNFSLSR